MLVIYRMTDIPSTNPSPIFQEDKYLLNELCLKSFIDAYKDVKPKMIILADYCGQEYDELVQNIPFEFYMQHTQLGINGTCLKQYEIALEQDDDILFQECDYIYRSDTGKTMVSAIKELGLVSPYDHRNFYIDRNLHSEEATLKLVDDHHFRSTERNTMTFGVRNDVFKENYKIFQKYGYLDGDVWYDLKKAGHTLYVPIPSFATHLVTGYLAPSVDWEAEWLGLL